MVEEIRLLSSNSLIKFSSLQLPAKSKEKSTESVEETALQVFWTRHLLFLSPCRKLHNTHAR